MTVHNKAQLRYKILDKCLRDSNKDYTLKDLLDTVNLMLQRTAHPHRISERQLYSDMAYLRSESGYGAVIETYRVPRVDPDGRTRFYAAYRYKDPKYSIDKIPLTHQQMRYVQTFISSFDASINSDVAPWAKKTVAKMIDWIGNFDAKPIFRYENNEYQGGVRLREVYDYFRIFLEAIDCRKSVCIVYKNFEEVQTCIIHPFYLKQFMHRWHVMGVTSDKPDKVVAIPLEKIQSTSDCNAPFIPYAFNPDEYFDDFIGVNDPGGEPVDIHLHFFGWGAYYLFNNPIHASQRSKWIEVDGQMVLDVHIVVKVNLELRYTLSKFIDCMRVLSPQEIVDQHLALIQSALRLHSLPPEP